MSGTWKDIENLFIKKLQDVYPEDEIRAIYSIIIEDIAGITPSKYIVQKNVEIDIDIHQIQRIIAELQSGKPIQHILGKADFYGNQFVVNQYTLIPRPETEELVHLILNDHKNIKDLKIIDIGTGSGCIPITLNQKFNSPIVSAVDISKEALAIAQLNNTRLNQTVNFICADIFEWEYIFSEPQQFDIIVSNPPYITHEEKADMHINVLQYEPHSALFVEDTAPLIFYDHIADFAKKHLTSNGTLYFEINQYLSKETADLIAKKGFKSVEIIKDINGADRMIKAKFMK